MSESVIQTSFAAGEISPHLYGRVDLEKYHIGAARMLNFFVDYRGGTSTRQGTKFISRAAKSDCNIKLIRFQFSVLQAYILEFGDRYMRVIMDGGMVTELGFNITGISRSNPATVLAPGHNFTNGDIIYISGVLGMTEVDEREFRVANSASGSFTLQTLNGQYINSSSYAAWTSAGTAARIFIRDTPWLSADIPNLKFTQSADTLTITHPSYPPYNITRTQHYVWSLTEVTFDSSIDPPTGLAATSTPSSGTNNTTYAYVVTAIGEDGTESVASNPVQLTAVSMSTELGSIEVSWNAVSGARFYNVYRTSLNTATDIPVGAAFGYVGQAYGLQFVDANVVADFTKTPPVHRDPFAPGGITEVNVTAGGGSYDPSADSLVVSDPTGTGFVGVPIIIGGVWQGVVIENSGRNYTSPSIGLSSATGSGGAATAKVGPSTGNWPGTVTYFQQRKYYAGSNNQPDTLWATQPGAFSNMDVSTPTIDSDALTFTLVSNQVNNIKYMLGMPGGLVILTGAGAWQLSGGSQNTAVTATNALAQPQAFSGCADVLPIQINYNIIYVQNKGSIVRNLEYNFFVNIYTGTDMTVLSSHLFNPRYIVDGAYAEEPFKVIWYPRDDGVLLGFTFLKDQDVYGWSRHTTDGLFKAVATVQEGQSDATYFVVERVINGQTLRYIERFAERIFETIDDAWFVDCGLSYSGAPISVIVNLDHLEGKTITGIGDGSVISPRVVVNGQVTLDQACSKIILGLGYSCQLQTLRLDTGQPNIQGKMKKIPAVTTRVYETRGLKMGTTFDSMTAYKDRKISYTMGEPIDLFTGDLDKMVLDPSWNREGQICFQQDYPLPATILAVIPDVVLGDTWK